MPKKTTKRGRPDPDAEVTVSTGNVFADMGRPDADELLAKAALVQEINALIKQRGLTQTEAAELLGMHQRDVSLLLRVATECLFDGTAVSLSGRSERNRRASPAQESSLYSRTSYPGPAHQDCRFAGVLSIANLKAKQVLHPERIAQLRLVEPQVENTRAD